MKLDNSNSLETHAIHIESDNQNGEGHDGLSQKDEEKPNGKVNKSYEPDIQEESKHEAENDDDDTPL